MDSSSDEAFLRELGRRLTSLRLEQNLTQALLAERAGVSKRTLQAAGVPHAVMAEIQRNHRLS